MTVSETRLLRAKLCERTGRDAKMSLAAKHVEVETRGLSHGVPEVGELTVTGRPDPWVHHGATARREPELLSADEEQRKRNACAGTNRQEEVGEQET